MSADIKEILITQEAELLDIDLDSLKERLETGDYDRCYVKSCNDVIAAIRRKRQNAAVRESLSEQELSKESELPQVPLEDLSPYVVASRQKPDDAPLDQGQAVMRAIEDTRIGNGASHALKRLARATPTLNEDFVEAHINDLSKNELSTLLECIAFSEGFLERYFPTLNHDAIARYQTFSEEFFIRHFSDLNASTVLKLGRNSWRVKENRSSKLDAFLRLKGVRY